jgi:poly-gamma-glutamate synthesis protein (capsule biosynthesis protein)
LVIILTACQSSQPVAVIPASDPIPTSTVGALLAPAGETTPDPGDNGTYAVTALASSASPSLADKLTIFPPAASASPLPTLTSTPVPRSTQPVITTLLFTGVIVPARCVQAAIDERGNPDYPYEEVKEIITKADLAVGTLNATISDFPPHTGCRPTYVLVGSANNADALARAGFDAMSVATNHIKNCGLTNCGNRAFFDTLENLRRVGITAVGAGKNQDEAMQPVVLTIHGVRFGIVSLGQIEPMAFAGPDKPGIAVLNEENLKKAIDEARKVSDVVIAMPHWGPEDTSTPNWSQRNLARQLVEAGADIVVGNHTHVVQGVQEIDGIPVFYGLGNFVFDQDLEDHQQGVILLIKFEGKRYAGYQFVPIHIDHDGRVHVAESAEAAEILQRIHDASKPLQDK